MNPAAREGMCLTSLFGGLSLANGGLGAVHGFAGVIGGMFGAPHGEVCASLLPAVMKYNVKALKELGGKVAVLDRYREISVWLTGDQSAMIEDGVEWLKAITEKLFIPSLKQIGIHQEDFDEIVNKSAKASSMQKNPLKLSYDTLANILSESY
jgi:alcohol dehydrogenase class IV